MEAVEAAGRRHTERGGLADLAVAENKQDTDLAEPAGMEAQLLPACL